MATDSSAKTFDRFLVLLAILGVLTVGLALVAALRAPVAGSAGAGASGDGDEGSAARASVSLSEFAIDGDLQVPAGELTLDVANEGSQIHNLAFEDGPTSDDL
ncbi:MAG: hypothetical protein ACLFWM_00760, partial [Actinomycetota bacterium]